MPNEEYVYFLTVKQAQKIAKKHESEPEWTIWADVEAIAKGMKTATIYPNTGSYTKYNGGANLPLCRAHGGLTQCAEEYRHEMAHIELEADHASPQP